MILGLIAGELLRGAARRRRRSVRWLASLAAPPAWRSAWCCTAGVCPIVKRIWTPSWAIFSAGWAALLLAALLRGDRRAGLDAWAFPLVVVGMNSIAMYVIVHVADRYTMDALQTHLGTAPFAIFGPLFVPVLLGFTALAIFWLMLLWMYRRRIFLRL